MNRKSIGDRLSKTFIVGMTLILWELALNPAWAEKQSLNEGSKTNTSVKSEPSQPNSIETQLVQAEKLFDQGKFKESLQQYQQALAIAQQQGDRLRELQSLAGLGAVQISLKQEKQAIATLLDATKILQSLPVNLAPRDRLNYRQAEGEVNYQYGRAYLSLEQFDNALKLLENSLAIRKEVGDRYREGKTLATIGIIYVKKFEFPKSVGFFENGLKLSQAVGNRASEAQILFYLASTYSLLGKKEQALALAKQSGTAYRAIESFLGEATALNLEANIYNMSLEYAKSIELNLKALELVRQSGDRSREAGMMSVVATSYRYLSQYSQAIDLYQQGLKIYRELGDRPEEGRNLKNMAEVYLDQGKNREALDKYTQAKSIYLDLTKVPNPKQSDKQTLASILVGEGSLYTSLSQYPKALKSLQEARSLYESVGDKQGEGVASMYLAGVYLQLGEPSKVTEILKKLPELAKYSPQLTKMAESLIALLNVNPNSVNPQAQLKSAQDLLEFFKQSGSPTSEAAMLSQIGSLYFDLQQPEKSITSHQQALEIFQAIGDRAGVANSLYNLGLVYSLSSQSDRAFVAFQGALKYSREVGNRNQESKLLGNLGILIKSQYPQLAIAFLKQAVNVTESIRQDLRQLAPEQQRAYQQTIAYNYRLLADLLLQQGRVMEALQVLDLLKVQELQEYLQNVKGNARTAQGLYIFPEENLQTQAISSQPFKSLQPIIESNQKIIQQLQQTPPAELNRVPEYLQKLPQGQALLYPLILSDRLELILFTPNKLPIRRSVKISESQVLQLIQDFQAELRDAGSLDVLETASKLYDILIKPLEADLAQTNTILYAPDGQLRYIPLTALYDGKQWLVEKYRINNLVAYSLSDFGNNPPKALRIVAGAFGGQPNSKKFGQAGLPATLTEVQAIASALPNTTKLIDNDFSRQATESLMRNNNIVHLATHAEFNVGKPENSFLIFGNGDRILLNEMKDLPMSNVDLIVLSACQTGVGKLGNGIEILGFGYQVQRAGAKAAISSLWQVSDEGTQVLMQEFYRSVKTGDRSKAESLRQAQIATIRSKDFSHPFYWSAFIIIGNGV
ncbi:CHAT domain-containing protein [Pseudanabaena sp. FACHB-1998]|uniref:CHAT domain-containing protein n=1 Tax=Pseudanabaena sp. FACHB-1998 TaxID=2692858 RepID=UPI001680D86B|nr:CHAT domain-containing protein [Pseudanabaena sp. FACHB-1998]MBD2176380.1 CHAT domain-containing protein [Pseudanabaena sp. FACHB-1998]